MSQWQVNYGSAIAVVGSTAAAASQFKGLPSDIKSAAFEGTSGMPPEFGAAAGALTRIGTDHAVDTSRISLYVLGCTSAASKALGAYEKASAEMVAGQALAKKRAEFDYSILGPAGQWAKKTFGERKEQGSRRSSSGSGTYGPSGTTTKRDQSSTKDGVTEGSGSKSQTSGNSTTDETYRERNGIRRTEGTRNDPDSGPDRYTKFERGGR